MLRTFAAAAVVTTVLVLASLAPSGALAQQGDLNPGRTGAVLRFEGRGGEGARGVVSRAIENAVALVPPEDIEQAAAGADLGSTEGVAALAHQLNLDLVVTGRVRGRGRRARTEIHVLDRDGAELATRTSTSRRLDTDAAEAIQEATQALDERDAQAAAAAPPPAPAPAPAPVAEPEEEQSGSVDDAMPLLVALAGIGIRTRDATFTLSDGGTRQYTDSVYPEIALRVELRPFASSSSWPRGFVAVAEASHSLLLSSEPRGGGTEVSTSAYRLALHIGYMVAVADDEAEIGGLLGLGLDAFQLDDNTILPSTSYGYIRIAPRLRWHLIKPLLYLDLEPALRLMLGGGDIVEAFGTAAGISGWDVFVAAGGSLDIGFAYQLRIGITRHALEFEGMGSQAQGTEGSDAAWTFMLLGGWRLP